MPTSLPPLPSRLNQPETENFPVSASADAAFATSGVGERRRGVRDVDADRVGDGLADAAADPAGVRGRRDVRRARRGGRASRDRVGDRVAAVDHDGVALPDVARRGGTGIARAVDHRELGAVRHARERDPDERLAVLVPLVDLAGEEISGGVEEADVGAVPEQAVRVVEPGDRGRGDAHQHGEVRERGAVLGLRVAVDREDDAAGEARGCDGRKVDLGPRERRGESEEEEEAQEFLHGGPRKGWCFRLNVQRERRERSNESKSQ